MAHEREMLEAVIAACNQARIGDPADATPVRQMAAGEGALGVTLGRLFALSESYPELQANQNMMQLSEELTSTANRIAFACQGYNMAIKQFPGSPDRRHLRLPTVRIA